MNFEKNDPDALIVYAFPAMHASPDMRIHTQT